MTLWEFLFQGPGLAVLIPCGLVIVGCLLAMVGQAVINRVGRD